MTKKLKKKMNRIALFVLAILTSVIVFLCLYAKAFVTPMSLEKIEEASVAEEINKNSGIQLLSSGDVIVCESIVQGARDNNLSDRNLYF